MYIFLHWLSCRVAGAVKPGCQRNKITDIRDYDRDITRHKTHLGMLSEDSSQNSGLLHLYHLWARGSVWTFIWILPVTGRAWRIPSSIPWDAPPPPGILHFFMGHPNKNPELATVYRFRGRSQRIEIYNDNWYYTPIKISQKRSGYPEAGCWKVSQCPKKTTGRCRTGGERDATDKKNSCRVPGCLLKCVVCRSIW